ncbi:MAG: amidohydrolase family protein [Pseudolabrys sp.]
MTSSSSPSVRENVDLLILGGTVVTMDAQRRIIADGAVAIKADRIVAVGKRAELEIRYHASQSIEAAGDLITPGLIDGHNHPIHFMTKGAIDDMAFLPRFKNIVVPYEHGLSEEETHLNALATFVEMISHGTTCFNDPGNMHPDGVGRAAQDIGIRGIVALEAADKSGGLGEDAAWQDVLAESEDVISRWNGAEDGRIRAWFSLNNPHRVSDELCVAVKGRADALGVGIHGHVTIPKKMALDPNFQSPLRRYEKLGVLGPNLCLVHLVHVVPEDVHLLVDHDVKTVHCPGASMLGGNGSFAHGTIPELIDAGVVMALGSDAGAVSRTIDLVRQMYLVSAGHKDVRLSPSVVNCYKAFEMVTLDAAKTMLWDDEIGSLEVGKKADIVIMDTSAPEMHPNPHANPIANLVYSGTGKATKTVVIDGRIVMRDRTFETIDVSALMAQIGSVTTSVLGRLNAGVKSAWPIS